MTTPVRSADPGGKIIKDGNLRYRHSAIGFQKWKQRYVAFKVTNSGRLEFVIYKEPPAIPDNEVKYVAIDEYGGLETNLRLDSEKYTFALITSSATECFSVDTPQELTDWTKVIQEYLGKELVLNISIPYKQNILKAGKAQLRIRNLGFTITTSDNPPRAQGSWQVIHIRKYGGSDYFKFETGSRCPTGECLYTIQTEDNRRVKTLFSELSQHRPIFTDDRVGRRMTLERSMGSSSKQPINRTSLPQPPISDPPSRPLYENREIITSILPEGAVGQMGRRHSAATSDEMKNPSRYGGKLLQNGTPVTPVTIDDHPNRQYANWSAQPTTGRASPTKKPHAQLPVDYYSVTPPPVIQHKSVFSSSTPGTSPESEKFMKDEFLNRTSGFKDEEYSMVHPTRMSKIVGDHIMFKEEVSKTDSSVPAPEAIGEMYQNLKFLQGNPPNTSTVLDNPLRQADLSTDTMQPAVVTTETDWAPPNYTNVQLALETVQSKDRKRSEPSLPSMPARRDPKSLLPPLSAGMKSSQSHNELSSNAAESGNSKPAPDYYNMCVPDLPANSTSGQHISPTLSLTSVYHHSTNGLDSIDGDIGTHTQPNASAKRLSADLERRSRSPVVHMYDTLVPLPEDKDSSSQLYDKLSPLPPPLKSSSSSPEPVLSPTDTTSQASSRYARKVQVIQHHHKYEYIDVALEHSEDSGSSDGVFSPTETMAHPLTWMSSPAPSETANPPPEPPTTRSQKRMSLKETNSRPRKKQLPLQTTHEEQSQNGLPPQIPRVSLAHDKSSMISSKPVPATRRGTSRDREQKHTRLSVDRYSGSSDETSSFELIPDMLESLRKETVSPYGNAVPNENERPRISSVQVELVREPSSEHTPPPLPPRNNSDGEHQAPEPWLTTDNPPLPPRPSHRLPLPPVQIDFTKTPTPPKPKFLNAVENSSKKYVALKFGEMAEFDDNTYSTISDQPVVLKGAMSDPQLQDERVFYSAVNFPVTAALHSTIRERMTERANS